MNQLKSLVLGLGILSMALTSCSDDDGPMYSSRTMENSELKTILMQKGYTFNEQGALLLDDLANNTTSLDLSGTGLTDFSGLEVFPNLTDLNLSNNGYEYSFDFAKLPDQITGVDLTDNKLYHFDNLVSVNVAENGDETVTNIRNLKKLYLPVEAKYNINQLMRYYVQNKGNIENGNLDLRIADENGTIHPYNTIRDIPNKNLRDYLKNSFADLFTSDDKLDISKHLISSAQKTNDLFVAFLDIDNFEGIQYIIQNPYWEGANITLLPMENAEVPYFEIPKHVSFISLTNIESSELMPIEKDNQLKAVYFTNVRNLKEFDLRGSLMFGQRDVSVEFDNFTGSGLIINDCPNIEKVVLPEKENLNVWCISLECLPSLRTCDLSNVYGVCDFVLGDINSSFEMYLPKLLNFGSSQYTNFAVSPTTYNTFNSCISSFISTYYTNANPKRLQQSAVMYCPNNTGYYWEYDFK